MPPGPPAPHRTPPQPRPRRRPHRQRPRRRAAAPAATGGLIQIGIFSVEANAKRAVDTLAKSGVTATVKAETSQGKPFWSVTTRGDKAALARIKAAGFTDAYFLKG